MSVFLHFHKFPLSNVGLLLWSTYFAENQEPREVSKGLSQELSCARDRDRSVLSLTVQLVDLKICVS